MRLILCLALFLICNGDLTDEVLQQLDQLKSLVTGKILAAHLELQDLKTDFVTKTSRAEADYEINIQNEQQSASARIVQMSDLGAAAGQDVSMCTIFGHFQLDFLPGLHMEATRTCINRTVLAATQISDGAVYKIDVSYNKVNGLEFQVRQCNGDVGCMASIITEIELETVQIPNSIEASVLEVQMLSQDLEVNTKACTDDNLASFVAEVTDVVQKTQDCIEAIWGF